MPRPVSLPQAGCSGPAASPRLLHAAPEGSSEHRQRCLGRPGPDRQFSRAGSHDPGDSSLHRQSPHCISNLQSPLFPQVRSLAFSGGMRFAGPDR